MAQVRDRKQRVGFIEPMLASSTETLPEGKNWSYELKLDGYRALGLKSAGKVEVFELVAQIEFLEWTPDNHLRHSRFVGLREDKNPRKVVREA